MNMKSLLFSFMLYDVFVSWTHIDPRMTALFTKKSHLCLKKSVLCIFSLVSRNAFKYKHGF